MDSTPPRFPGIEILDEIARGVGGMGRVYRALEPSLDRIVAVKTARAALAATEAGRELFRREARAAAKLDHPNILRIYRFDPEYTPPFFVMQYVQGRSLDAAVAARLGDYEFVARCAEQVARALDYAHGRGVIHRDVKPSNILVGADGEARVADFGLALLARPVGSGGSGDTGDTAASNEPWPVVGAPCFVAPEIYAGGRERVTPRIDIYALGVSLYQLVTGRLPFDGADRAAIREAVLTADPPLPQELNPAVPEPLQRVCLKAMERDPAQRYESAAAMAEDLRRFREGKEVSARPTRYLSELKGKLQNHLTDIRLWQEQNLIDVREMDRLARPYFATLEAAWPLHQLARRFPWETAVLRLGGWLVLLSSVLWPAFYWDKLERWERIAAVGFPAVAMNLVGAVLLARGSRVNALIYLSTGALLLPLATCVVMVEYNVPEFRQSNRLELFVPNEDETPDEFEPTNLHLALCGALFLGYCVFLLFKTRGSLLVAWSGVGVYLCASAVMPLLGLKQWVDNEQVSRAFLIYLGVSLALLPLAVWMRRWRTSPAWAAIAHGFFLLPFCIALGYLAWFGATEWLDADAEWDDERINLWFMANGLIYAGAAVLSLRSRVSFVRFWGMLLTLLVPLHLLGPTNLLFEKGAELLDLGGQPVTSYELASLLIALALIVVGTRLRQHALALPALLGLAVFVFRATDRHFVENLSWPLGLALLGGLAMVAALSSLLVKLHRQRESIF